jgi:hypothetical protein
MEAGGDKGKGQQEERSAEGDRNRANNTAIMTNGSGNASKRGPPPHRPNQYGYNPRHDRGRAYGGYARGWQRQSHQGYMYSGSCCTAGSSSSGSDQPAQSSLNSLSNTGTQVLRQAATAGEASQQSTQPELPVPEGFKAQKEGKTKVDKGQHSEGKEKLFCFRCYKPGHGKLECISKLLCDICDSQEHLTGKCPILKQPRLLAHPCGYDVSGLGFYHIYLMHLIPWARQTTLERWSRCREENCPFRN